MPPALSSLYTFLRVHINIMVVLRISESHKKAKQKVLHVLAEIIVLLKDAMSHRIICSIKGITT